MQAILEHLAALPRDLEDPAATAKYLLGQVRALPRATALDCGLFGAAVGAAPLLAADKLELITTFGACAEKKATRRPRQYWTRCRNFFTSEVWVEAIEHPELALECLVQHLSRARLVCPSEPTAAEISALAAVIMANFANHCSSDRGVW